MPWEFKPIIAFHISETEGGGWFGVCLFFFFLIKDKKHDFDITVNDQIQT